MKRITRIAIAAGAALSLGLAAAAAEAQPFGMMGWGGASGNAMHGNAAGNGVGPGYGMGNGMGPDYAPAPGYSGMGNGMGPQTMFEGDAGTAVQRSAGRNEEIGISDMHQQNAMTEQRFGGYGPGYGAGNGRGYRGGPGARSR